MSKTGSPKLVEQKRPSQARFLFGTRGMNSVQGARRSSLGGHPGASPERAMGIASQVEITRKRHSAMRSQGDCGWCAFGTGVWNLASRVWGG